jgi:protein MpaA
MVGAVALAALSLGAPAGGAEAERHVETIGRSIEGRALRTIVLGDREAERHVETIGRSVEGRALRAIVLGDREAERRILVVGCIHGNECAGIRATRRLARLGTPPDGSVIWIVHQLNPDGARRGVRQNARGVDLNRNFRAAWRAGGRPWDGEYPGPRPFSEPETRAIRRLVLRIRPHVTIWYHQPQRMVRAWGASVAAARRYGTRAGLRYRSILWPRGTGPRWQNTQFRRQRSFVVELAPGPLADERAARHARAARSFAATRS